MILDFNNKELRIQNTMKVAVRENRERNVTQLSFCAPKQIELRCIASEHYRNRSRVFE